MSSPQKIAALEGLLERVRRNRNQPRTPLAVAPAPLPAPTAAPAAAAAPKIEIADDTPEIVIEEEELLSPAPTSEPATHPSEVGPAVAPPEQPVVAPPVFEAAPTPPAPAVAAPTPQQPVAPGRRALKGTLHSAKPIQQPAPLSAEPPTQPAPITPVMAQRSELAAEPQPDTAVSVEPLPAEVLQPPVPPPLPKPAAPAIAKAKPVEAPPAEVELEPAPAPEPAPAIAEAVAAGTVTLRPVVSTPIRVAAGDVGEFIGAVQATGPATFGEVIDMALSMDLAD